MCLDVSSPANSETFNCLEHKVTIPFHDGKIQDGSRTVQILDISAHILSAQFLSIWLRPGLLQGVHAR